MTRTTSTTKTTPTAQSLLTDIGFVLALTQKVKADMGKASPPAERVPARVAARKQIAVAA